MRKVLGRIDLFLVALLVFGIAIIFASAAWPQVEVPTISSCCIECVEGSGMSDQCHDDWSEDECEAFGGDWLLGENCETRDDCDDFCEPFTDPIGACCYEWEGHTQCQVTTPQVCGGYDGEFYEDMECADIECGEPVPTMGEWAMLILAFVLAVIGGWLIRRRWNRTWFKHGPFR